MAIYRVPGANALAPDKAVRAKMEGLRPRFPPSIAYLIRYDTAMFVSASRREVAITLVEAMALVSPWCSASCKAGGPC